MKKTLSLLLCLILILGCLPLTAMADDTTVDKTLEDQGETGISLTTGVPELASITVTPPNKAEYYVGDTLETYGMKVMANYNYTDDTPKDVTSAATLSGFDSSTPGTVTVTVSYAEGTVTLTETFTVTISNVPTNTYTVSVSADPADGGTVSGDGNYAEGSTATVTATPNDGYSFVRWTENNTEVSTDASYGFTVTEDRTLVAVFEKTYYTVTIDPGEVDGEPVSGTPITVTSEKVYTWQQARARKEEAVWDLTQGCFFNQYGTGDLEYKLPLECAFTAPPGKEFDCWLVNGINMNKGSELPLDYLFGSSKDATITAVWKDTEQDPSVTLSIPSIIDVSYGDTRTTFDVQVKEASFTQGKTECKISLWDSAFTCSENGGSIPFTMNGNGKGDWDNQFTAGGGGGTGYKFYVYTSTTLPYTVQAYIDISSDAWAVAKPGNYTATLRMSANFP